ncbi:MAG: formyltransferase family protein [Bradyrhizobium sp.]
MKELRTFVWCTYRDWSFQVLEALLDLEDWRCGLVITTADCRYDFSAIEAAGITVMRIDPRTGLKAGADGFAAISDLHPAAVFHYGWSWIVPEALCQLCPNVTMHPGKLPRDRGGSPIQNQIRNGEDWTYINIMELVAGLDEGPVYCRARISLAGEEADAVWARMIAGGAALTRKFLGDLARGRAVAEAQDASIEPTIYKRVTPAASRLDPTTQTSRFIHDVIRAHNETDANTYVRPAFLPLGESRKLITLRACLVAPEGVQVISSADPAWNGEAAFDICHRVNNGEAVVSVEAADGGKIFVTRCRIQAARQSR